jgi:hypothetical protein
MGERARDAFRWIRTLWSLGFTGAGDLADSHLPTEANKHPVRSLKMTPWAII